MAGEQDVGAGQKKRAEADEAAVSSGRPRSSISPVTLAQVGVIIALLAVSAQVSVAIGPVPFTLQTLVVALAALVLTPAQAAAALAGYVLLGALGLPIFSLMRGGLAMIAGPTGGYLYGFILSALLGGFVRRLVAGRASRAAGREGAPAPVTTASRARVLAGDIACAVVVVLVCYAVGTAHFMLTAHVGLAAALGTAVIPFIIPDALKCVAAILVAAALRKAIPSVAAR